MGPHAAGNQRLHLRQEQRLRLGQSGGGEAGQQRAGAGTMAVGTITAAVGAVGVKGVGGVDGGGRGELASCDFL